MKYSTKIAKESIISFIGMGIGDAVLYIFIALLARLVGLEYLGIYSLANSVTRLAEVLGKVGLDAGLIRFIGINQGKGNPNQINEDIRSTLKIGFIFSVAIMSVQIILSGWLVYCIFHGSPILRTVIIVNALTLPFCVLTILAAAATQGFQLLKYKVFVTNIITPIIMLISMIGCYYLFSAKMTIIVPVAISSIIGFLSILYFLNKLTGIRFFQIFNTKSNSEILKFSYPLMFVAAIDTLLHWMDIMMIGHFTNAETVGLYYPAIRTTGLLRLILVSLMSITMPMISQLYAQRKMKEMGDVYKLTVRWIMTLAIPITIFFILFPEKIMLLFGNQYLQAAPVLVISTVGIFVLLVTGIGSSILTVIGYPKYNLVNSIIAFVTNFSLNSLWIPRYGIVGAAWATLITYVVFGFLRSLEVWYFTKLHPLHLKLLKSIFSGIITFILILSLKKYFMPYHTLITLSLAGFSTFLIYLVTLFLFKFDSDDKEVWKAFLIIGKTAKSRQPYSSTDEDPEIKS